MVKNKGKKEKTARVYRGISYFIKFSLVIAILLSIYEQTWLNLFVSVLTLILIALPKIFQKRWDVFLPLNFQLIILIFIYAAVFLGEVGKFYQRFWWWDSLLHTFSGLALGFAGFLIIYMLDRTEKVDAKPIWYIVFSFAFALSLGALWEIFEFIIDSFFNANMQKARYSVDIIKMYGSRIAIRNTMIDLILDSIGALVASITGFLYLKKKNFPFFSKMVKNFEEANPRLFKIKNKKVK